ncbi:MAG TPA: efflux RND transporter periplasmic adaptor subunit [Candidatus Hydrogenedens sp.]|nr:efflux RND transporter periplasmic adaptor subunit [Candidatus Hydrogenedens sp.]HOK10265.1 efflux RND transporter periplasmic adaptor subunit [Candidatus Hydrogenedens sp.]HOL20861.1 efflux RND transporter periplasmic adaptor subunit [Candidatus Hydrogenedens sp.]HPP59507.1 efflux RND transporter periplasmic adaptor subunit [Candidatus Hydrogenedens sp.]
MSKPQVTANVVFPVTRGNFDITILEGGSIEAKESLQIKSEVQGETKILSIVEEGYYVTPEDVQAGKILVELDAKKLLDQQTEQELRFQNAKASLANAEEQYEIQKNQNEIDIRQNELAVKFARMEIEKYLGIDTTEEILKKIGVDEENIQKLIILEKEPQLNIDEENNKGQEKRDVNGEGENNITKPEKEENRENTATMLISSLTSEGIDFRKYADSALLGDGVAQQTLQKYTTDVILSEEDLKLAQKKLEGTRRLFEKAFVTQTDLETDELTLKRKEVALEQANTNKSLFIQYEFPKQAERLVAEYIEAVWKYIRIQKLAKSRLAQAEANLNSAKAQFALESRKKRELEEQIQKCTIRATKPGLVVYGGEEDRFMQERIQEGTSVRERQIIITIPDTSVMQVRSKIHESNIKRVKQGQKVRIRVDAFPDELLTGMVEKVAVLPNAQNRWLNPDLKVYDTFIIIDGTHTWLKPGMTAQVEILVAELKNVLYVPLQSVFNVDNQQVCYVQKGNDIEMRIVKTGEFNESFIEIKEGLKEGEKVLLYVPGQPIPSSGKENQGI